MSLSVRFCIPLSGLLLLFLLLLLLLLHGCAARAGLLVQSFTQDGRFPTYCPGGTQPAPEYDYIVDKYSTVNVEEITINTKLSWYCAGNVSDPCNITDSLHPHCKLLAVRCLAARTG